MTQEKENTVIGTVIEALPNTQFRVQVPGDEGMTLCYLAGKMRINHIKVLIGDKVELLKDPYGGKARIIRRA